MVEQTEKNYSFNSMYLVPCDLGNTIVLHGLEDNVEVLMYYSHLIILLFLYYCNSICIFPWKLIA